MKDEILKLRKKGYSYKEIVKELGCSLSTVSYHCNRNGLGGTHTRIAESVIKEMNKFYKTHTVVETADKFGVGTATVTKYCDHKRVILSDEERKRRARKAVSERRKKLRLMAVEYKGGCCERCGYDKCNDALEFHHLDPDKKDFSISVGGNTRSWKKIKEEIDKCILVCANCHREIHFEERRLDT